MDKKYLVIFIIISLIILCKHSRKEKFTTSATDNQVQAIGNISNWLSTNSCNLKKVGIPDGTIVIWSGAKSDIPAYWHLCNGDDDTPDLRNKFILGATHESDTDSSGNVYDENHSSRRGKKSEENDPDKKLTIEMIPEMTTVSGGTHTHKYDKANKGTDSANYSCMGCNYQNYVTDTDHSNADTKGAGAHTHTVGTAAASQQNIPIPRHHSLYFIIKVSFYTDAGVRATAPGPSGCTQSA